MGLSNITFVTDFAKERQRTHFSWRRLIRSFTYVHVESTVQSSVMQRDTHSLERVITMQLCSSRENVGSNEQRAKSENYNHEITVT